MGAITMEVIHMSTGYWLATPSTKIWMLFVIMSCVTTWALTIYYIKTEEVIRVDLVIANAVLKISSEHCIKIKAKNFTARADGGQAQAGCARK